MIFNIPGNKEKIHRLQLINSVPVTKAGLVHCAYFECYFSAFLHISDFMLHHCQLINSYSVVFYIHWKYEKQIQHWNIYVKLICVTKYE